MDFDLHYSNDINIPHLSASTINSFISSRYAFYQSKVLKKPFQGNQWTARGKAVEHGVNTWIENPSCKDLLAVALAMFDEEMEKSVIDSDVSEVRDSIKPLLDTALDFYQEEFAIRPAITQRKIEGTLKGVNREIIGYLDYLQPNKAVRDCKVVSKTPSKLSQAYILQGAFYRQTMDLPVIFDFFVPNKKAVHKPIELTDDEYIFGISYLTRAAQVIEELESCDNPKRVIELMSFPNLDDFYNTKEKQEAAKEWGIAMP